MKQLVLKDGTIYQMEDNSNVGAFRIPVQNYAEIDGIVEKLTADNLSKINIGKVEYRDVVNENVNVQTDDSGAIVAIFANRMGTDDIVQDAIDSFTYSLIEGGIL